MPLPPIHPPLINSSNPWATTPEDLQHLFDCPHTGAVTTRTSLLQAFDHNPAIHQHTFFNPHSHSLKPSDVSDGEVPADYSASLNTLGYSPIPLSAYLAMIPKVTQNSTLPSEERASKPFILSVTGSPAEVRTCYHLIQTAQTSIQNPLCMEINLSCPNIPGKPPPAYSGAALSEYLRVLAGELGKPVEGGRRVAMGIKTPPFTYLEQFRTLVEALLGSCKPGCPVDFVTATNTLGSCLVLAGDDDVGVGGGGGEGIPAIDSATGEGIGGMAGSALHPLALGNVRMIRRMLDEHEEFRGVDVIGVGGVGGKGGYQRMRAVGAKVVGVGTALGREGVGVFGRILQAEE
ncbi:dihydroorotate dehydrogenase [Rachicladosporium monterosium]|uniref:Dihydroorotate dehydrogenase n=1 Tax=Rachicladosporium monterosium TaxID=1507873 RepID=A0ABR0LC22_9PEZI|nr:dihydroorotate dehydrogenase [Rachicladosporium monterosium]